MLLGRVTWLDISFLRVVMLYRPVGLLSERVPALVDEQEGRCRKGICSRLRVPPALYESSCRVLASLRNAEFEMCRRPVNPSPLNGNGS